MTDSDDQFIRLEQMLAHAQELGAKYEEDAVGWRVVALEWQECGLEWRARALEAESKLRALTMAQDDKDTEEDT